MFRLHVIKNDEISGIFKGSYYAGIYVTAHFTLLVLVRVPPTTCIQFLIIFYACNPYLCASLFGDKLSPCDVNITDSNSNLYFADTYEHDRCTHQILNSLM